MRSLFVLLYALICLCCKLSAQTTHLKDEAALRQIDHLIRFGKSDSAWSILQPMLNEVTKRQAADTPWGLKLQLSKCLILIQQSRHKEALLLFYEVRDKCEQHQQWEIMAKTCLAMARLYQKLHWEKETQNSLEQANALIKKRGINGLDAEFNILYALWHLNFGFPDSVRSYTAKALKSPQSTKDIAIICSMKVIDGVLIEEQDNLLAINKYKEAANVIRDIEDYVQIANIYKLIASNYLRLGRYNEALIYCDSSITSCYQSIAKGNSNTYILATAYRIKSICNKAMGAIDSSLYYNNKAHLQEIRFINQQLTNQLAEVDARYNNEKKQQQIDAQKQKLILKNNQLIYTLIVFGLVLLLVFGLFWSLQKQQLDKKELAEQNALILQQAEQLKLLDAAKSRFFANISHELRTPLTLLTSPLQALLKEKQLTEKQTWLLQMAERSGKQLSQLINEILDLRKLEMGKMTLTVQPTELQPWFKYYFAQFESLAVQKHIDYQIFMDVPENAIADLDREKCRQILFNLLSNAFKFTPQGGRIEAEVQVTNQLLQFCVANSGPGIHPDDLPFIFNRYFQSNRPEKPVEGGTGIGLALCREYVQLFDGNISAESTPDVNTIFRVTFPLHNFQIETRDLAVPVSATLNITHEEPALIPIDQPLSIRSVNSRVTILLVEDNPDLRNYICSILHDNSYSVITAEHGQAALALMNKAEHGEKTFEKNGFSRLNNNTTTEKFTTPDLILSDLMMPVMDGYQLLERLKSDDATRHIPVVMLTARAETHDKLKALRIGVDDYLTKPFDEEELLTRIENLLKNQAARQQEFFRGAAPEKPQLPISQPDREWLEAFENYVQKHLASDTLSISWLAKEFAMSESTLLRQLKRLTGLSPLQYIQEVRLDKARQLLETRACNSIIQVASLTGYNDARSFSRGFKQRFGKLPSELIEG